MSTWKKVLVEDDAVGTSGLSLVGNDPTGGNVNLRLSDGTNNDDVLITAGSNITIDSIGAGGFTIAATDTNTMGNGFSVGVDTNTNATTITEGETLTFAGGTGISTETTADGTVTITCSVTDTNTMGNGFSIGADTNTNATTITEGETLTIAGGANISTETTADGTVTITGTNTMGNGFSIGADTNTNSTTITEGETLTFAGGTGISTETTADGTVTITCSVTDTNTMGNGFSIGADTNTNATTITEGETLTIAGGSNCSTETTADGTVTITAVNDDVSNANLLTALANLQSTSGAADENIVIGTDAGDTIVITGNLQVSGTTTTVNSSTLDVADINIVVASGAASAAAANGAGITVDIDADGGYATNPQLQWNSTHEAFSQWKMVKGVTGETDAYIAGMVTAANYTALDGLTPGIGTLGMVGGALYIQTA